MKRKILIVPYVRDGHRKTKWVVVQHAASREWTLISGTCEPMEPPEACAKRELAEETLGHVQWTSLPKRTTHLRFLVGRGEKIRVDVYFVPLIVGRKLWKGFREFAAQCQAGLQTPCENCQVAFVTYRQLLRKRLWAYIREDILAHPLFRSTVDSLRLDS